MEDRYVAQKTAEKRKVSIKQRDVSRHKQYYIFKRHGYAQILQTVTIGSAHSAHAHG